MHFGPMFTGYFFIIKFVESIPGVWPLGLKTPYIYNRFQ